MNDVQEPLEEWLKVSMAGTSGRSVPTIDPPCARDRCPQNTTRCINPQVPTGKPTPPLMVHSPPPPPLAIADLNPMSMLRMDFIGASENGNGTTRETECERTSGAPSLTNKPMTPIPIHPQADRVVLVWTLVP